MQTQFSTPGAADPVAGSGALSLTRRLDTSGTKRGGLGIRLRKTPARQVTRPTSQQPAGPVVGGIAEFFLERLHLGQKGIHLERRGADETRVLRKDRPQRLLARAHAAVAGEAAEQVGVAAPRAQRLGGGERVFL